MKNYMHLLINSPRYAELFTLVYADLFCVVRIWYYNIKRVVHLEITPKESGDVLGVFGYTEVVMML